MPDPLRILVVAASPDDRPSTVSLRILCEALDRRSDVDVSVWYLRPNWQGVPAWWPDARVVDRLRTAWAPRLAALVKPDLADRVRGLMLRRWYHQVRPDVVILDDGLGARVIPSGAHPIRVVRRNYLPSADTHLEASPLLGDDADLVLSAEPADAEDPNTLMHFEFFDEFEEVKSAAADHARARIRHELAIPADRMVVVGWGADAWIDAPDAFVRAIWYLEDRCGIVADGVWLDAGEEPEVRQLIETEARLCGLTERFHLAAPAEGLDRVGGDAVLLLHREPVPFEDLEDIPVTGVVTVTSAPALIGDEGIVEVPPLDTEAAGLALAEALRDTEQRRVAHRAGPTAARLVERLRALGA